MHHLITDGGSRGNPGPAAIGYRILDEDGTIVKEHTECIGTATNNEAEYRALIAGLQAAWEGGIARLEWSSDAQIVVRQMSGAYQVKRPNLRALYDRARALVEKFDDVSMKHRLRSDAFIAAVDGMVAMKLDECTGRGRRRGRSTKKAVHD